MYCNRGCLAAEETVLQYSLVGNKFVLQYKLYCELGEGLGRDTAWAGAGRAQLGAATRPGAQQARRRQVAGALVADAPARGAAGGRRAGGRRAGRAAGALLGAVGRRPGRWARGLATGCALGALSLFSFRFDSVLFLSRFLDIVREPGS